MYKNTLTFIRTGFHRARQETCQPIFIQEALGEFRRWLRKIMYQKDLKNILLIKFNKRL
jgi:hypothetical protein